MSGGRGFSRQSPQQLYQVLLNERYTRGNGSTRGWGGTITTPGTHLGQKIYIEPLELTTRLKGSHIGHNCWDFDFDFTGKTIHCALLKKQGQGPDAYFLASERKAVQMAFAGIEVGNLRYMDFFGHELAFAHYVLRDGPPLRGLLLLEDRKDSYPQEGSLFRVTRKYPGQGGVEPTIWIERAML